jgi:tetratricopeptide (TPR) repeat protein
MLYLYQSQIAPAGEAARFARQSEEEFQHALKIREKLAAANPAVTEYRRVVGNAHNNLGLLYELGGRGERAEAEYRQSLDLAAKLRSDHPEVIVFALDYGIACQNQGNLQADVGRLDAALKWYGRAAAAAESVLRLEQRDARARELLFKAHAQRGSALTRLGRHAEAVKAWQLAREFDGQIEAMIACASALAEARSTRRDAPPLPPGYPARAMAEADALSASQPLPGCAFYRLACIAAFCSSLAAKDATLSVADRARRSEQYASRAVTYLERTRTAAYFQCPDNVAYLEKDPDLDPLRPRKDFQQFLATLQRR